jgi:hypothetical protein
MTRLGDESGASETASRPSLDVSGSPDTASSSSPALVSSSSTGPVLPRVKTKKDRNHATGPEGDRWGSRKTKKAFHPKETSP